MEMSRISEKVYELIANEQQQEIDELKAYVELLREAVTALNGHLNYIPGLDMTADELLNETPSQSLNHIKAQAEKETVILFGEALSRLGFQGMDTFAANYPYKYTERSDEGGE